MRVSAKSPPPLALRHFVTRHAGINRQIARTTRHAPRIPPPGSNRQIARQGVRAKLTRQATPGRARQASEAEAIRQATRKAANGTSGKCRAHSRDYHKHTFRKCLPDNREGLRDDIPGTTARHAVMPWQSWHKHTTERQPGTF